MRKPNIILINCDDLGYGDLGCYGSTSNYTPHIDRLAHEGLKLTDFYMASPICSPSRGAMMTGCYPPRIGFDLFEGRRVLFPGQGVGLSGEEETIAQTLRQAGYRTKIIGKWHCGDQPEFLPLRHGFDEYFGLPYSNDMGRQAGGKIYCPLPLVEDEAVLQQQPDLAALTERYTAHAVRFIRENQERPFFLYFAHMYVHLPHYAPQPFQDASENGDFGAVMGCLDWSVGTVMQTLKECALDEDTLVIFTSDNGGRCSHGGSNGALRGKKGQTWEGGMRVPCLMRWPGHLAEGRDVSGLACSLDLYATLCAMAQIDYAPRHTTDSLNLAPMLLSPDTEASPRDRFFYYLDHRLEAVRDGQWKLKLTDGEDSARLLFDLASDPGETENCLEAHPDVVARLDAWLEDMREDLGDTLTGASGHNCRPIGQVANPRPLTEYDEGHPYIVAMYDKGDRG